MNDGVDKVIANRIDGQVDDGVEAGQFYAGRNSIWIDEWSRQPFPKIRKMVGKPGEKALMLFVTRIQNEYHAILTRAKMRRERRGKRRNKCQLLVIRQIYARG